MTRRSDRISNLAWNNNEGPSLSPFTHDLRVHDYHDVLSKIFARLLMESIYSLLWIGNIAEKWVFWLSYGYILLHARLKIVSSPQAEIQVELKIYDMRYAI